MFKRGGLYDNLPEFNLPVRIPYIAWYGDPSLPRPKLRWLPSATYGFNLGWINNAETTSFMVIGLDCDGANTGSETPYDDWIKVDFYCIRGKVNKGNGWSGGSPFRIHNLIFEDNVFRRWDVDIHLADNNTLIHPVGTSGSIKPIIRRNIFTDSMGRDGHSLGVYGEGWADGSIIEQNYFSYMGYTRAHGRNSPDFRTPTDPVADKRSHAIYYQNHGGGIVIRENIFYNCAAHSAQQRTPGIYDDNVEMYCALSSNNGDHNPSGSNTSYEASTRRNLVAFQEDISNHRDDWRGKALIPGYTPSNQYTNQNIAYGRLGRDIGANGTAMPLSYLGSGGECSANVLYDWGCASPSTADSGGQNVRVDGAALLIYQDYYEIRAAADRPDPALSIQQPPHAYDDNYQLDAPAGVTQVPGESEAPAGHTNAGAIATIDAWKETVVAAYVAAGFPHIDEATDTLLRERRLGEWRDEDFAGTYINTMRAKAKSDVSDKYSVTETNLDPYDYSSVHSEVLNGIGGSQSDGDGWPGQGGGGNYGGGEDPGVDPGEEDDYKLTLEAAVGAAVVPAGVLYASQTDLSGTVLFICDPATVITRKTENPPTNQINTDAVLRIGDGSSVAWQGGAIDARGSHNGILQRYGAGTFTLGDCAVRNAAYKQISLNGSASLSNVTVESNIVGGPNARPTALLADWEGNIASTVAVDGLTIGMFYGSTEGQTVKMARVTTCRLTNIQTPQIDADTQWSLVLAEELGYTIVKDSLLPRRITHFPDTSGGADAYVDTLVIANTTIGNPLEVTNRLHDLVKARNVVYFNCNFVNAGQHCIYDETPASILSSRLFVACTFSTAYAGANLITHDDGAGTLTNRIRQTQCNFVTTGAGSWNKPADWDASEISLPTGYALYESVGVFT